MRTTFPANQRQLTISAIALAFLLHLAILNILIFRFVAGESSQKPHFLSLGSILSREETQFVSSSGTTKDSVSQNQFLITVKTMPASAAFYKASNTKPSRLRSEQQTLKEIIKPTEAQVLQQNKAAPGKPSMDVPPAQPSYEPLKLEEPWSQ